MSSWISPFNISENDQLALQNNGLKKVSSVLDLSNEGFIIYDNPFNLLLNTNSKAIISNYEEILKNSKKYKVVSLSRILNKTDNSFNKTVVKSFEVIRVATTIISIYKSPKLLDLYLDLELNSTLMGDKPDLEF